MSLSSPKFATRVESPGAATTATRHDTRKRAKGSTGSSTSAGVRAKETSAAGVSTMDTSSAGASSHVHAECGDHAGADTTIESQAKVPGLSNVDAVEGAKCASSKRHANCWSCSIVWRTMRPVTQGSKSVFGTSSESHLDLLHVNLAMSLRPCIDAISTPSALFAGTDMPLCFVVVT